MIEFQNEFEVTIIIFFYLSQPNMDSLDTPLHNPEYAEISVNVIPESGAEGNPGKSFEKFS